MDVPERIRFSIVIPTFNRPVQLAGCLAAIAELDYPCDRFEVLVVDDGSPVPPWALVASFQDRLGVRLLAQAHHGPASARNAGASAARGTFLVFTDDDCAPAPDLLRVLERHLRPDECRAVGGRTINRLGENVYSATTQGVVEYLYEYFNATATDAHFFASNNLAVPREAFLASGGFDATFPLAAAEDRDFCDRWREHGHALTYVAEAIVHHAHRLTLPGFWRQHFNYGRGALYLQQARLLRGRRDGRFQPPRFYVDLLLHPLRQRLGTHLPAILALTLLSQIAYAAGYFWERLVHEETRGAASLPAPVRVPEGPGVPGLALPGGADEEEDRVPVGEPR